MGDVWKWPASLDWDQWSGQKLKQLPWLTISGSLVVVWIVWPSLSSILFQGYSSGQPLAKKGTKYTTGLVNRGNDCYVNATLQALSGAELFLDYLKQLNIENSEVVPVLAKLTSDLAEPIESPRTLSAAPLIKAVENFYRARISTAQQDAHEFLHLILETLEKQAPGTELPMKGEILNTIVCLKCGHTTENTSNFLVYTVDVPNQSRAELDDLVGPQIELIEDYRCGRCDQVGSIRKKSIISRPSQLFCIHLSRSLFSIGGGSRRNGCVVDIPDKLEISGQRYKLQSSVSHAGGHQWGHYTASRRKPPVNRVKTPGTRGRQSAARPWWTISDMKTKEAKLADTAGAYIVFYALEPTDEDKNTK